MDNTSNVPKLKQNASEGCNSCASLAGLVLCFIACFILLVIAPLPHPPQAAPWVKMGEGGGRGVKRRGRGP